MLKFFKETDPEVVALWALAVGTAAVSAGMVGRVLFGLAAAVGACS